VLGVLLGWGPMVGASGLVVPGDRRRLLALPAAIVLFEWFHTHAPFGGVPLSMLAMTQTRAPMLPIARLGGHAAVDRSRWLLGVAV
jgi:apolipoprotein N-acyltransferase